MATSSCSTAAILMVFLALTHGAVAQLAGGQSVINLLLGGSQSPSSPAASTPAPSASTPNAATPSALAAAATSPPAAAGSGSTPAAPTPAASGPATPSATGGAPTPSATGSGPSTPVPGPAGSSNAPAADTSGTTPSAMTPGAGSTPGAPTPASTPSTTPGAADSPANGTPAPSAATPTAAGNTPASNTAGSDGAFGPSTGGSAPAGSTNAAPVGGTPAPTPTGAAPLGGTPSSSPTGTPTGSETVGSPAGATTPSATGPGAAPSTGLGAGATTPPASSPVSNNAAGFEGLPPGTTPAGVGTSPTAAGNSTGGAALAPIAAPTAGGSSGNTTNGGGLGGVVFAPSAPTGANSNSTLGTTPSAVGPAPTGNATGGPLAGGSGGATGPLPTVQLPSPPARNLPPAPPADWASLPTNIALVLMMEIRGKYITPWTSPKSYVVSKVLHDRYLMSTQLSDISIQLLNSFSYLSYDNSTPSRRRMLLSMGRNLLQQEKSGVQLKIAVLTNTARTNSEISSVMVGIVNGTLVDDITAAGVAVENVTMTEPPKLVPVDQVNSAPTEESSGFKAWMAAVIVVGVLLLLPAPIYCLVRMSRKKRRNAIERQQAEVAAARARAQSRIVKPKSFTLSHASHNIMVRSGPASIASSQAYRLGSARSLRSQGSLDNHSVRSVRFQPNPSFSHDGGLSSPGLPPSFTLPSPESLRSQYNHSPRPTADSREDASIVEIYANGEEGRRSRTTSPR